RNFFVQICTHHHFRDETDPFRFPGADHLSGEGIVETMLGLKIFSEHGGGIAGRKMTEIYFGKTEARILRGDGDVTARHHGEGAAETPTRDSCDDRLWLSSQHLVAPTPNFLAHLVAHSLRLTLQLEGILL